MLSSFYAIGKPHGIASVLAKMLKLEKEAGTYIISMQSSSSSSTHLILASPRSGTFTEFFTVT